MIREMLTVVYAGGTAKTKVSAELSGRDDCPQAKLKLHEYLDYVTTNHRSACGIAGGKKLQILKWDIRVDQGEVR